MKFVTLVFQNIKCLRMQLRSVFKQEYANNYTSETFRANQNLKGKKKIIF